MGKSKEIKAQRKEKCTFRCTTRKFRNPMPKRKWFPELHEPCKLIYMNSQFVLFILSLLSPFSSFFPFFLFFSNWHIGASFLGSVFFWKAWLCNSVLLMDRDEMEGGDVLLSHPVLNYTIPIEKSFRLQRTNRTRLRCTLLEERRATRSARLASTSPSL